MTASIQQYNDIVRKVEFFYKSLRLEKYEKGKGRKLAIPIPEILAFAIFQHINGIATKKQVWVICEPLCSYKTLVVNMNRFALLALLMLTAILKENQRHAHPIKHTDSTDLPVCTNRKAYNHKTMNFFSNWGYSGKGHFYGLKLHITTDLEKRILAIRFTPAAASDVSQFMKLNHNLFGIFVADAAYISEKLSQEFHIEGQRILFAKPRRNMKKIITAFQFHLYNTRMRIELSFRGLKMFFGLVTSLPRSGDGYFANYIYALLAYHLA